VVEIAWLPRSNIARATLTAARRAAADLWAKMAAMHAIVRRFGWPWPSRKQWEAWAKGRAPGLSAQSTQQVIRDFMETLAATTAARKAARPQGGEADARYPWKERRYRDVPYTNQDATIRGGWLCLSHGRGRAPLRIELPRDRPLPGRLVEVSLAYGVVRLVCEVADVPPPASPPAVIGVDLGVNTLIAATDGVTAVLVSGREAKAIQQWRNKGLAALSSRIARSKQGSRRQKKLRRAKHRHRDRCARKQKDLAHKSTRAVADAFPGATVVVGRAFHDAARKLAPRQAQQVSQAFTAKVTAQLSYKLAGVREVGEAYSSQACPACGCLQKCKRVYRCGACGFTAPRDVVGSLNIRAIGMHGALTPSPQPRIVVRFVRPLRKYPGPARAAPGSPGGTPAGRLTAICNSVATQAAPRSLAL
jgi:transposase